MSTENKTTIAVENKILGILKEGEKSSTEIASLINRNYYDTIKILDKLESKGKIEKIEAGKFTFWKLKNE